MLTLVHSLDIFRQVLHAVAYLHKNDVIHRDIKPGNILIDEDLQVTLIDLGACRSPLRGEITIEGDCSGTPSYMSPEQAAILVGVKDPAVRKLADSRQTDIYALGLLLYHLLSGRWPHGKAGNSEAQRREFYRRRAREKPETVEFPNEELGRLAMAMLLPANKGRPSNLSGVTTTFEAAFAAMRDDSQRLSPLCNKEDAARLEAVLDELECRNGAEGEGEEEGFTTADVSEMYTAAQRLRQKLEGFGFLGAAGAMGGLVVLLGAVLLFGRGAERPPPPSAPQVETPRLAYNVTDVPSDLDAGTLMWDEIPGGAVLTDEAVSGLTNLLLRVQLITGLQPGQKRYPCSATKREIPWKGGCWRLWSLSATTKEEAAAACKASSLFEPELGWCERQNGMAYGPIFASETVKPPTTALDIDSPDLLKDPAGYQAIGGSSK